MLNELNEQIIIIVVIIKINSAYYYKMYVQALFLFFSDFTTWFFMVRLQKLERSLL